MCGYRVDFMLNDSEDGNSLLLDIAVFKYQQFMNFMNFKLLQKKCFQKYVLILYCILLC